MNVSGTGSMEQMQMRKMDGSGSCQGQGGGGGGGGGGMKEMMQSLSVEDQTAMKEEMSTMSMDERMAMVSQMKEVDKSSMTDEEYTQTLLDILNQEDTNEAEEEGFSVYA